MNQTPQKLADKTDEGACQYQLLPDQLSQHFDGKDELNLAEFPICAISSRPNPEIKTLKFQDTISDKLTGETITRTLTITASEEYGLPTAADNDVLLALIQISQANKSESPIIEFTLYKLLNILNWPVSTYSYQRLRESINRWLGVTLYYDNAWRDKKTGKWIEANFHFLELVEYYKAGKETALAHDGQSVIKWNDFIFRNLSEGHLKTLDYNTYRDLKNSISKRLLRFLDKRFYKRDKLSFGLEHFAYEKIGLARPTYDNTTLNNKSRKKAVDVAQLKRRLLPGIRELETIKFIRPRDSKQRFTKDLNGIWHIHFERYVESQSLKRDGLNLKEAITPNAPPPTQNTTERSLEERLIAHGVTRSKALKIVAEFDRERIELQINALEFLVSTDGQSAPANKGGWLVKAITEDYHPPAGFKTPEQIAKEAQEHAEKLRRQMESAQKHEALKKLLEAQADAELKERQARARAYLETLSEKDREELEERALRGHGDPSSYGKMYRQAHIDNYALRILDNQKPQ
jgi:hypothetical protein